VDLRKMRSGSCAKAALKPASAPVAAVAARSRIRENLGMHFPFWQDAFSMYLKFSPFSSRLRDGFRGAERVASLGDGSIDAPHMGREPDFRGRARRARKRQVHLPDTDHACEPTAGVFLSCRSESCPKERYGMRVDRGLPRAAHLALFIVASLAFGPYAFAQAPSCVSLQNQWAALDRKDAERAGGLANAARRQNAELQRSFAYARQIGCDNRRFLIFGSDPPPHICPLMARISRMQADLANLQAQMGRPGGAAQADEQ